MILKTVVTAVIIFASMSSGINNTTYDENLVNNNRIPGPVVINNVGPGVFISFETTDYDKWEREFKKELGYEEGKECPEIGSCDIPEEVWLGHFPTLNEMVNHFFLPKDREWALKVAYCESSAEPGDKFNDEVNESSGATGFYQHLPKYWTERSYRADYVGFAMNHPKANVGVASWLFYEYGGSSHWNSSKSCWQ